MFNWQIQKLLLWTIITPNDELIKMHDGYSYVGKSIIFSYNIY